MQRTTKVTVSCAGRRVGTLALLQDCAAFEYESSWLAEGFAISPFSLPLEKGVKVPEWRPFYGLFGIFSDSLPDGWGRLLLDRLLVKAGENPESLTSLDRLCVVGKSGMGALTYEPCLLEYGSEQGKADLDALSRECCKILNEQASDDLDKLFRMGGSSGGARPKVLADLDGEPWIIKFRSSVDKPGAGRMEYDYALCAGACGVEVPRVRLLPSDECAGYFAVQRFDRVRRADGSSARVHMASASALLEAPHYLPSLDYCQLMKLSSILSGGSQAELQKLYRLMCFNVFAHNRDDHSKNFTWLFDEQRRQWRLAPAYDLTYSNSVGGEHATTVDGNGANPGLDDLLRVACKADINKAWARRTALQIQTTVDEQLAQYLK